MLVEEISRREQFFKSEGAYLPEDLCPYVGEPPTMFEVLATGEEVAINLDPAYIVEVGIHSRPQAAPFDDIGFRSRRS